MKYQLFRFVAWAAGRVPRRVAYAAARLLAILYWRCKGREAAVVAANLKRIAIYRGKPLTDQEARLRARDVYFSFAKMMFDYYYFARRGDELASVMEVDNIAALARAREVGKGAIVVTAHLGVVENGGAAIVRNGFTFNVVALHQADPRVDTLFQEQRRARGMSVIGLGRATRECLRALQRNEVVGLLGDRDFTTNRELIEFFGAPARLPTGLARLALAMEAPIVPGFCVRLPGDRFKLFFYDPIFVDKTRDSVESLSRQIVQSVERAIGDYSDQWHCFHNLWDIEEDWKVTHAYITRG